VTSVRPVNHPQVDRYLVRLHIADVMPLSNKPSVRLALIAFWYIHGHQKPRPELRGNGAGNLRESVVHSGGIAFAIIADVDCDHRRSWCRSLCRATQRREDGVRVGPVRCTSGGEVLRMVALVWTFCERHPPQSPL